MKDNGFIYGLADTKVTGYVSLSVTRLQLVTENLRIETVHKIAIKYVNDEIKLPLIILDTQSKFSGHLILAFDSLIWGFCRFNITDRILHGNKT